MSALLKQRVVPALALFTSMSTLICCALPAAFVLLGAGATLAGFISAVPQLTFFSEHKIALFIFSGIMLALGGWLQYRARFEPCPIDPALAQACTRTRRRSAMIYCFSLALFCIGILFAFILPAIL
jgi:hypothetical protein